MRKRSRGGMVFLLLLLSGCALSAPVEHSPYASRPPAAVEDGIAVYFSPAGGAMAAIIGEIGQARGSVDVSAYLITARSFVEALEAAQKRGVRVRIILDHKNIGGLYSTTPLIAPLGQVDLAVWLDDKHK